MKDLIHRVVGEHTPDISLDEVDISTDAGLLERYGTEIPVLMIDGKKVAKYRITEEELRRRIQSRGKG